MADSPPSYFINRDGQTVEIPAESADQAQVMGYVPAGKAQIDDFHRERAYRAKYGTTGQALKAATEGFLQNTTLSGSTLAELGLGISTREDMRGREDVQHTAHMIGGGLGLVVPIVVAALSGGAAAAPEAAALASGTALKEGAAVASSQLLKEGVVAGSEALAEGAAKTGGEVLAKEAAKPLISKLNAPYLVSKIGELATKKTASILGETAKTATGRIVQKAIASGAGTAAEGLIWTGSQVVHEKALGDPNLTTSKIIEEVGLSGLLSFGIGGGFGALNQLVGEAAGGTFGAKLSEWADSAEANQNIKTAAGPGKGRKALGWLYKKFGPEGAKKIGQEAGDLKLVGPLDNAEAVYNKSSAMTDDVGPRLSGGLKVIDDSEGAFRPKVADVTEKMRSEVLAPLMSDPASRSAANVVKRFIRDYEGTLESDASKAMRSEAKATYWQRQVSRALHVDEGFTGGDKLTTLADLHRARVALGKSIFGLKGDLTVSTATKEALHDLQNILSDEIDSGIGKSGGDVAAWRAINRQYQVAATVAHIAEQGMSSAGLSGIPASALLSAAAGLIHGGPLGAAALGGGAMLAKRYGPQILAAGARTVRQFVDEGAAEGLASKTAGAIAAARQAGETGEASSAAGLARAWGRVSEKVGETVGLPAKDMMRDAAQEQLAHRGTEGTPMETVAALSQLERTNQRVENRIDAHVSALMNGAQKVARGETLAGVSQVFAQDPHEAHATYVKRAEQIRTLAANPQAMLEHMEHATADLHEHAPETAKALQVGMARSVATLHASLPRQPPRGPLQKPEPPSPDEIARFGRCYEAVSKPTSILKQGASCTLTKEAVAAAKSAHPALFAAMVQKVVEKALTHRGPLPYAQRQMISLLMGADVDGTQSPSAIQSHQASYSPQHPDNRQGIRPTSKGLEKLHRSNRLLTASQASASRGNGGD